MKKKLHVAILCGGKSAEHEISIRSARNVIAALDPDQYETTLIAIDKQGHWHLGHSANLLIHGEQHTIDAITQDQNTLALIPGTQHQPILHTANQEYLHKIDVAFPILHGPFGEDGTVQGLLKLANIPYVGSDILASAVNMDKEFMKRLLRDSGLPVARFMTFHASDRNKINYENIVSQLGVPFFVKPANLGSSVGISKVHHQEEFENAIAIAFDYDNKIILEAYVRGREIEVSVLGNEEPMASVPGEIIPHHEFYSYAAKYLDENGASLEIPAKLPAHLVEKIKTLAVDAFKSVGCSGMARVDFFVQDNEEIIINELNTIPGFTSISMYPRLWEASGISYSELVNRLIKLALDKFAQDQRLKTNYIN